MSTPAKILAAIAAALVALAGAFYAGRASVPLREETTTKTVEQAKTAEVAVAVQAQATAAAADIDARHVVRRTVTKRDSPGAAPAPAATGCPACPVCPPVHEEVTVEETVDETSDETSASASSAQLAASAKEAETSRSSETTRVVDRQLSRLALMLGADLRPFDLRPRPDVSADLELRLIGPLVAHARATFREAAFDRRPDISAGVRLRFELL